MWFDLITFGLETLMNMEGPDLFFGKMCYLCIALSLLATLYFHLL